MRIDRLSYLIVISLLFTGISISNSVWSQGLQSGLDYNEQEVPGNLIGSPKGGNNPGLLQLNDIEMELHIYHAICGEEGGAMVVINESCTANPTVQWSSGDTGLSVQGLVPGGYQVTISDGPQCEVLVESFTITDDHDFTVNIVTQGNPCAAPLILVAEIDGANPDSANFLWNTIPPLSTQSVIVSTENTYTVTVEYGTCVGSDDINVQFANFEYNVLYTEYFCEGTSGSAGVSVQAGHGPFFYEWTTGAISPGISFTQPGEYGVTVTDSYTGCGYAQYFSVFTYPAVQVVIAKDDITCFGDNDGEATAVVSGGTPEYSYLWSTTLTSQTITNLVPGNYAVTVTDSNGCVASALTTINTPTAFSYNISPSQGICQGQSAQISVIASGGVHPYTYSWSDSPTEDSVRTVSPNATQTYTVTVYDKNGCTQPPKSTTITVSQTMQLHIGKTEIPCYGECSGIAELNFIGGIPPYFYHWEDEDSTVWTTQLPMAQNLCAGKYTVTITDMLGCTVTKNVVFVEPDSLIVNAYTGAPSCHGYNDGYVYVEVYGGTPYVDTLGDKYFHYNWSSIGPGSDSIPITGGFHWVTVTDANGCSLTKPFFVNQPEAVFVTNPPGGTICIGQTFTTTAQATGGTVETNSSYNFVWSAPPAYLSFGPVLQVSPDTTTTYTLVVTDDNGCYGNIREATVKVKPPLRINSISSNKYHICKGESVTVNLEAEGGSGGPYTYYFNEQQIVNIPHTFNPSETGYYTYRLEDGCGTPVKRDSVHITVHPIPHISFFSNKTNSCPPATIQFTETTGSQTYSFLWSFGDGKSSVQNNPEHTYVHPGHYTVSLTVWTEHGCKNKVTQENMIRVFPVPVADFQATPHVTSIYQPSIYFQNISTGGNDFFWNFGDGSDPKLTNQNPTYTYTKPGEYEVTLTTKNNHNCWDSVTKKVRITDEFTFYAPNAFMPNRDGNNDYFYVTGNGIDPDEFHFSVYDRTGLKVFETNVFDPVNTTRMAWDGTNNGNAVSGDPIMAPGLYVWFCRFIDLEGKPHQKSGTVMLLR